MIATREPIPALFKNGGAGVNISPTLAPASVTGSATYSGTKAAMERITAALAVVFLASDDASWITGKVPARVGRDLGFAMVAWSRAGSGRLG